MALHYSIHRPPTEGGVISKDDTSHPTRHSTILLLLHGGALSSRMYRTLIPHLQSLGYSSIITPDLPGHGKSKELGPFTFDRSTEGIHRILLDLKGSESGQEGGERKVLLVGVSLGGQAALDLIARYPEDVDAVIVAGASIRPPDEEAGWEMPRMPSEDKEWMDLIMEDVGIVGMMEAQEIQARSLEFEFRPPAEAVGFPPVLVVVGEEDVAMARRDAPVLFEKVKARNCCEMLVLEGAWHNHPIDVPEQFARVIGDWDKKKIIMQ
ncbi:hypothetical protein MMC10_008001 [Thelotrema lepadinum]|nr:hypothetical protein [Thelotrema lepadinum]